MNDYAINITEALDKCTEDITCLDTVTLDAHIRAYDLLNELLSDDIQICFGNDKFTQAAQNFLKAMKSHSIVYDVDAAAKDLEEKLKPLDEAINEARFKAAAAASLHEFAKEVFHIWQHSGIFARRRALKDLRARAGFRLEPHRIGNYVAKTFDLMNDAHSGFAKAQQARFAADVSYKIKPDIYEHLRNEILRNSYFHSDGMEL